MYTWPSLLVMIIFSLGMTLLSIMLGVESPGSVCVSSSSAPLPAISFSPLPAR
ncbi:hypothetical protein O0544_15070 [Edwardsiella anguillarum]|nr:hypothetical protein [Edwardsiella anguillarum]